MNQHDIYAVGDSLELTIVEVAGDGDNTVRPARPELARWAGKAYRPDVPLDHGRPQKPAGESEEPRKSN